MLFYLSSLFVLQLLKVVFVLTVLVTLLGGGHLEIIPRMPTMIMQAAQADKNTIAPSRNQSSPDSPEVAKAKKEVRRLENKVWWVKTGLVAVLILAGAIGVGIAVGTLRSDWLNDDLRAAEKKLTALEIGKVEADSRTEAKRIEAEGKDRVAKVEAESREKIAGLEAAAEKSRQEIAVAQAVAAGANAEAAKANEKAEEEAVKRLELEKSIAPRVIPLIHNARGEDNFDPLRLFAGMNVEIECLPDAEPRRLAGNIRAFLTSAGWNVSVITNPSPRDPTGTGFFIESDPWWARSPSYNAGAALKAFLLLNGVTANNWPPKTFKRGAVESDPYRLKIAISLKPDPYFEEKFHTEQRKEIMTEEGWRMHEKMTDKIKRRDKQEAEELWAKLWAEWKVRKAKNPPPTNNP